MFSFDADWGNDAYWAPYIYDYVSKATMRERRTYNEELRLLSKPGAIADGRGDWLVGVYALDLTRPTTTSSRASTAIRSAALSATWRPI